MLEKGYTASRTFGWSLTVAVAVMGAAGTLAIFAPKAWGWQEPMLGATSMALVASIVCCIGLANCMAAHAQRAIAGQKKFYGTFWTMMALTGAFATASMIGVHLGWEMMAKSAEGMGLALVPAMWVTVAAGVLAVAKPGVQFAVEARIMIDKQHYHEEQIRRDERASARNLDLLGNARTAPMAAPEPPPAAREAAPAFTVPVEARAPTGTVIEFDTARLTRAQATPGERAAVSHTVRALAAAVVAGGLTVGLQHQPAAAEAAPAAVVNMAAATAAKTTELDVPRPAVAERSYAQVKALWEAGADTADIVEETGYPKGVVLGWVAQMVRAEQKKAA